MSKDAPLEHHFCEAIRERRTGVEFRHIRPLGKITNKRAHIEINNLGVARLITWRDIPVRADCRVTLLATFDAVLPAFYRSALVRLIVFATAVRSSDLRRSRCPNLAMIRKRKPRNANYERSPDPECSAETHLLHGTFTAPKPNVQ